MSQLLLAVTDAGEGPASAGKGLGSMLPRSAPMHWVARRGSATGGTIGGGDIVAPIDVCGAHPSVFGSVGTSPARLLRGDENWQLGLMKQYERYR
jgi:hypothetical protein